MLDCLLYRAAPASRPSYYRVEIDLSLWSDVIVRREWGVQGGKPRIAHQFFGNWRDASLAADRARDRALTRGYVRSD